MYDSEEWERGGCCQWDNLHANKSSFARVDEAIRVILTEDRRILN